MDPICFLFYLLLFAAAWSRQCSGFPVPSPPTLGGSNDGGDTGDCLDVPPEPIFDAEEYLEGEDGLGLINDPNDLFGQVGMLDEDLEDLRVIFSFNKSQRKIPWFYERKDWNGHVEQLRYTGEFDQRFRMNEFMFESLLEALRDEITVSVKHSMSATCGNEPIYPEVIMACGLRFLSGDTITSVADVYGISTESTRRVINLFLDAVDFNTEFEPLQIKLPPNDDMAALTDLALRWRDVSTSHGLMDGHIGALDGWIPRMEKPRGVSNTADYFSGHYQMYGLNIQAMCDPDLIFLYSAIAAPGKTNDIRAFSRLQLFTEWLEGLPDQFFISADNAYPLSRVILIPFEAPEYLAHEHNKVYNFYLSQLRIRIEMAFGRMTTKWRRLRYTLNFSLQKNSQIIRVCQKLHNYVIRMKQLEGDDSGRVPRFDGDGESVNPAQYGIDALVGQGTRSSKWGFLETVEDPDEPALDPSEYVSLFSVDESRRDEKVVEILSRGLRRPDHNKERNSDRS